jgi:hypothetical protein
MLLDDIFVFPAHQNNIEPQKPNISYSYLIEYLCKRITNLLVSIVPINFVDEILQQNSSH